MRGCSLGAQVKDCLAGVVLAVHRPCLSVCRTGSAALLACVCDPRCRGFTLRSGQPSSSAAPVGVATLQTDVDAAVQVASPGSDLYAMAEVTSHLVLRDTAVPGHDLRLVKGGKGKAMARRICTADPACGGFEWFAGERRASLKTATFIDPGTFDAAGLVQRSGVEFHLTRCHAARAVFVHIPKNGGTSVRAAIERHRLPIAVHEHAMGRGAVNGPRARRASMQPGGRLREVRERLDSGNVLQNNALPGKGNDSVHSDLPR